MRSSNTNKHRCSCRSKSRTTWLKSNRRWLWYSSWRIASRCNRNRLRINRLPSMTKKWNARSRVSSSRNRPPKLMDIECMLSHWIGIWINWNSKLNHWTSRSVRNVRSSKMRFIRLSWRGKRTKSFERKWRIENLRLLSWRGFKWTSKTNSKLVTSRSPLWMLGSSRCNGRINSRAPSCRSRSMNWVPP